MKQILNMNKNFMSEQNDQTFMASEEAPVT
jgi:hypothetical protein